MNFPDQLKPNPNSVMKRVLWIALLVASFVPLAAVAQPSIQILVTNGLAEPYGVAVDFDNNFYVTDSANNRIAKYNSNSGSLTNLAGVFGEAGSNDGPGVFARFFNPQGIVVARGGLIVADSGNHLIRRVGFDGAVTTIAGGGAGFAEGAGAAARFNSPSGLAADSSGNVFVADTLNRRVRRIDTNNVVTTVASGFARPTAVAVDNSSRIIYVSDATTHSIYAIQTDGSVTLFGGSGSQFISGNRDSLIATNALFNAPYGLLWVGGNTGLLVSDTGNRVIRRVYFNAVLNSFSVERYLAASELELQKPIGIAMDANGNFPLADLGAHQLLSVQVTAPQAPVSNPQIGVVNMTTNFFGQLVTALSPVVNSTFNNDVQVAILGEEGTETFYTLDPNADFPQDPSSRNTPALYANGLPEWSHTLIRPATDGSNVTIRAISTQDGRRPSSVVTARFQFKVAGPVINGKNPAGFTMENATDGADMWYTTDGSTPTNIAPSIRYVAGTRLNIVDGTNNVQFKVRAFKAGYTPSSVTEKLFLFSDLQTSSIGITRDFTAGIGSTVILPVEVRLAPDDSLKSLQFKVEVTPNGTAPQISTQFRNLAISTNDFIRVPPPSTNAPIATSYTDGTKTGLTISFIGSSTGLNITDSAVVALLAVPIPPSATVGQSYVISVQEPSGTSDGFQTPIPLSTFRDRTITITNVSYLVGDSAVASWYNAGDFGNGNLNNNDINNAFHASLGLFVPYAFSDVFDAMDTFPEDSAGSVGGDGQIRFLDWQIALQRSLRLSSANWSRAWAAGGVRTASSTGLVSAASVAKMVTRKSTLAWNRQAKVEATTIENAAPGSQISVPIHLKVAAGHRVAGMQLRAAVVPQGNAPALTQPVVFNPNLGLTQPITLQGAQDGLPLNQAVTAWSIVQNPLSPAVEGGVFLGEIIFSIPNTAAPGQSYTVRILNADGAPNLRTQYDFESIPADVWIGTPALIRSQLISDEWKEFFFGNTAHVLAQGEADPDGDGVTNLQEYLQGTNPAKLRFHTTGLSRGAISDNGGMKLRFFGKSGTTYRVESSSDLNTWEGMGPDITGQGTVHELAAPAGPTATRFYRVRIP